MELGDSLRCSQQSQVSILRQMNPIHTLKPDFPKIHFNMNYPSPSTSFKRFRPLRGLPIKILCAFLISHMRVTCPAYLIILDLPP
jgi:hypothetical protein